MLMKRSSNWLGFSHPSGSGLSFWLGFEVYLCTYLTGAYRLRCENEAQNRRAGYTLWWPQLSPNSLGWWQKVWESTLMNNACHCQIKKQDRPPSCYRPDGIDRDRSSVWYVSECLDPNVILRRHQRWGHFCRLSVEYILIKQNAEEGLVKGLPPTL